MDPVTSFVYEVISSATTRCKTEPMTFSDLFTGMSEQIISNWKYLTRSEKGETALKKQLALKLMVYKRQGTQNKTEICTNAKAI